MTGPGLCHGLITLTEACRQREPLATDTQLPHGDTQLVLSEVGLVGSAVTFLASFLLLQQFPTQRLYPKYPLPSHVTGNLAELCDSHLLASRAGGGSLRLPLLLAEYL